MAGLLVVNDLGDTADATLDGVCEIAPGGACTLRAALQEANAQANLERITFAEGVSGTLRLTSALPVVMETMSIVAGLSTMRRGTFLIASAIGTTPIVVIYTYAGAVSREMDSVVPAVVILVAVAAAGWIWYRANLRRPSSSTSPD